MLDRKFAAFLLGTLVGVLLMAATAMGAVPTLSGSFTCSLATPCGSNSSIAPGQIAVNESTGEVYVADSANDVVDVFSSVGVYVRDIPGSATTAGSFGGPSEIAVDNSGGLNEGDVYVVSSATIFAFDSSGTFLWQAGGFSSLCGVAVNPSGALWTVDSNSGLQQLAPADGATVGSPIALGVGWCHLAFDSGGNFFLNQFNGRVDKFDPSGTFVQTMDNGFNVDVAIDSSNEDVYTNEDDRIARYDPSGGDAIATFGKSDLSNPVAVAVDGAVGKVYVADVGAGDVKVYDTPPQHVVSVSITGGGGGSVTSDVVGISCGPTCSDHFDDGTVLTLTAMPAAHSMFTGWSGDCSGTAPCQITVGSDTNVTANFKPLVTLTVTKSGSGAGSVTSVPAAIVCGGLCTHDFDVGAIVTLSATPAAHAVFAGWSGGGCSGTGTCQVTLNAATTVNAAFTKAPPTVLTGAASAITATTATVAGTVNPNGTS
ncbi:MAG: hypothetical protein WAL03_19080, partial [Pseudolabrys sp.]